MVLCFVSGKFLVQPCGLVAVLKPATYNGASLTMTLTGHLRASVVDTSDERICHSVSLNAKGSLTSCVMSNRPIPCRLVSVISTKCGCGIFRFRHSFLRMCGALLGTKGLPIVYKNAKVCLRSILHNCHLIRIPRGGRLHRHLTGGSLSRLALVLTNCGRLRGAASMSAYGHTVHTVRVRRCCHVGSIGAHRFPTVGDLAVKLSISHRIEHRHVDHHLHRHLRRKVISRIHSVLTSKMSRSSLVCCNLRCGCLALCIVNGVACSSVMNRLRVTVRRFTGERVACFHKVRQHNIPVY